MVGSGVSPEALSFRLAGDVEKSSIHLALMVMHWTIVEATKMVMMSSQYWDDVGSRNMNCTLLLKDF
jgi:hypothetical protein